MVKTKLRFNQISDIQPQIENAIHNAFPHILFEFKIIPVESVSKEILEVSWKLGPTERMVNDVLDMEITNGSCYPIDLKRKLQGEVFGHFFDSYKKYYPEADYNYAFMKSLLDEIDLTSYFSVDKEGRENPFKYPANFTFRTPKHIAHKIKILARETNQSEQRVIIDLLSKALSDEMSFLQPPVQENS